AFAGMTTDTWIPAFAGMTTDTWIPAPAFAGVTFFRGNDEFGPLPGWGAGGLSRVPGDHPDDQPLDVVERHHHEQRQDQRQPHARDILPRPVAQRLATGRLHHLNHYLTAVEDRDRQQVEHREIDAQQRYEVEQYRAALARRLNGRLRDKNRPTQLGHRRLPRRDSAQRREHESAHVERRVAAINHGSPESDRLVTLPRRDPDASLAAHGPGARIAYRVRHGRHVKRQGTCAAEHPHGDRCPARSLDYIDEIIPPTDRRTVYRDDAIALLKAGERSRLVCHNQAQATCRGVLVSLYQSYVYRPPEYHVHRHAGEHYDEPRSKRFGLEPAVLR